MVPTPVIHPRKPYQPRSVLSAAERLRSTADDLRAGRSGVVAIACYTPYLEGFLAPVIGRFQRAHPDIRVEIEEFLATGGDVSAVPASVASLMAGSVDLAVDPRPSTGVDGFLVDESWVVAIVARGHPWTTRPTVPIACLEGEPLLLNASRDSFSRSAVERACHLAGFDPTVKLESRSSLGLVALAENGVGVAVLPDHVVPPDFDGIIKTISGAGDLLRREAWLCWRLGALVSPPVAAFVDEARRLPSVPLRHLIEPPASTPG